MALKFLPITGHVQNVARVKKPVGQSGRNNESIGVDYDDSFDYDSFVKEEFGDGTQRQARSSMQWVWMIVAFVLIVLFLKYYFPI